MILPSVLSVTWKDAHQVTDKTLGSVNMEFCEQPQCLVLESTRSWSVEFMVVGWGKAVPRGLGGRGGRGGLLVAAAAAFRNFSIGFNFAVVPGHYYPYIFVPALQ